MARALSSWTRPAGGILRSLVRESIEEHMDPERLRVLKPAEEQERALLRGVWIDMV